MDNLVNLQSLFFFLLIDKRYGVWYTNIVAWDKYRFAGMAQSVERRIGSAEVPGPIPGASFLFTPESD